MTIMPSLAGRREGLKLLATLAKEPHRLEDKDTYPTSHRPLAQLERLGSRSQLPEGWPESAPAQEGPRQSLQSWQLELGLKPQLGLSCLRLELAWLDYLSVLLCSQLRTADSPSVAGFASSTFGASAGAGAARKPRVSLLRLMSLIIECAYLRLA